MGMGAVPSADVESGQILGAASPEARSRSGKEAPPYCGAGGRVADDWVLKALSHRRFFRIPDKNVVAPYVRHRRGGGHHRVAMPQKNEKSGLAAALNQSSGKLSAA